MTKALLVGKEPNADLGYEYVMSPPYDAVVLYTPGLPDAPKNRALAASLASSRREMKSWGVVFTDGSQRRLITAQEARTMRLNGTRPAPGAVLTPLAKEILEGEFL